MQQVGIGAQVPYWQSRIVQGCRKRGKPVIVATNMLESMIANPTPTRAEVRRCSVLLTAIHKRGISPLAATHSKMFRPKTSCLDTRHGGAARERMPCRPRPRGNLWLPRT